MRSCRVTAATALQVLSFVAPMLLALLAWARLGPDRSRLAQEVLGAALEQLRADRDDIREQLIGERAKVRKLRNQLLAAGMEPVA